MEMIKGGPAKVLLALLLGAASCQSLEPDVGSVSSALTGDQVMHFDLPTQALCASSGAVGTSVAVVPAAAIDPTLTAPFLIATSCLTDLPTRNEIYLTNPTTSPPSWVGTITTGSVSDHGWGALALRGDRGDLIGCTGNADGHHDIYRIDVHSGATTLMFAAQGSSLGLFQCNGLAWDGATGQVFVTPTAESETYVYNESGTLLRSYSNPHFAYEQCSGSGIAVSGDVIFQGCLEAPSMYELDKSSLNVISHFNSGDQRATDLECDPFTFASQSKQVIWTKEAYNDEVYAIEIPYGTCNFGGEPNGQPFGAPCTSACPGQCVDGVCCNTTSTSCGQCQACNVPGSIGTCAPANGGGSCTDGNACTQSDTCNAGACTGAPVSCDDGDPSTADSCNPSTGCEHASNELPVLNPGVDQTIIGSCSSADLTYSMPTLVSGAAGTTTSCTTLAGTSSGAHAVTCIATDPSGKVSPPVSFTITVLQPLTMRVQAPLSGDSTPAMPDGSLDNMIKEGSVVPVKVKLFACGADVTTTADVTVRLGVTYRVNSSDAPNGSVTLNYSGIGDSSGLMSLVDGQYRYNLSTKSYQLTAAPGNSAYYAVKMTAAYNTSPGVVVGTDTVRLETR
jgi:hypothetical protein